MFDLGAMTLYDDGTQNWVKSFLSQHLSILFQGDLSNRYSNRYSNFYHWWCPFMIGMVQVLTPMVTLQKFPAKKHRVVDPDFW